MRCNNQNGQRQLGAIQNGSSIQHITELYNDTSPTSQIKLAPLLDEKVWRIGNSQGTESFSRESMTESSVVSPIFYDQNRGRSRRWGCLHQLKRMIFFFFITLCLRQAKCQNCDFPSPNVFSVSETDPADTEIFNATSYNRSLNYTYTPTDEWLSSYLNFSLNGTDLVYYMRLSQPLDLEDIYYNKNVTDISVFTFKLYCQGRNSNQSRDFYIMVKAISEWSPEFNTSSIEISVKETLLLNAVVINLTNWAHDYDVNPTMDREIAMYSFLPYTGDYQVDGMTWLQMLIVKDGIVVVKKELDYDALPQNKKFLLLGLQVADHEGRTGTASMTVNIQDDDTKPPEFTYPGCRSPCQVTYTVTVSPNITGHVTGTKPAPIEARDGDTLNYQIAYYIVQGPQNYEQYMMINNRTGQLTILKELRDSGLSILVLIVEAREVSPLARSTRTTLLVTVTDGTKEEEAVVATGPGDDDTTIIIVATVLAVAVFVVVVVLIVVMVYFKKRYKKTIHPENSLATFKVSGNEEIHVINNKTSTRTKDSKKILAQRSDSKATLGSDDQGDVYAAPPRPAQHNKTPQMYNANGNIPHTPTNRRELNNSQNSTNIFNGNKDSVEYLAPTSDTNMVTSSSLSAKMNTHELQMNSSEPHPEPAKFPPRPILTVLSGLKFPDKTEYFDTHYDTADKMGGDSTTRRELSGAREDSTTRGELSGVREDSTRRELLSGVSEDSTKRELLSGTREDSATRNELSDSGKDSKTRNELSDLGKDSKTRNELSDSGKDSKTRNELSDSVKDSKTRNELSDSGKDSKTRNELSDSGKDSKTRNELSDSGKDSTTRNELSAAEYLSLSSSMITTPATENNISSHEEPPVRKKKHRNRNRVKTPRGSEEIIYDGTENIQIVEFDSSFYSDSTKTRIKRSSRLPVTIPDPNDTRYWITVSDDY